MTSVEIRLWNEAQLRTRTGDPFLTMVDWPNFGKSETA